jgi:hypothetical protein
LLFGFRLGALIFPFDGVVFSSSFGLLLFCSDLRSGMPGVGVPAGWFWFFGALTSGIPGVGVPPGVIGEVWMPGGNGLELAFAPGAILVLLAVWQPFKNKTMATSAGKINLRGISNFSPHLARAKSDKFLFDFRELSQFIIKSMPLKSGLQTW